MKSWKQHLQKQRRLLIEDPLPRLLPAAVIWKTSRRITSLYLVRILCYPVVFFADKEISSKKRWRQVQVLINQVWARWLRDCLPTLISRKKWNQSTRNVRAGDLVLVVDEKTQRGDSPLARIMKTFPGKDDTVRVCEVKTKAGQYKKPVAKLALLKECSN